MSDGRSGGEPGPRPDLQYEIELVSDEEIGRAGGFLHLRRLRLRNVRPDGSRSREWVCDFVERARGVDAVVVALWRDGVTEGAPEVLLREGLRPAVVYGRPAARLPLPDERVAFFVTELVAGIIEEGERGLEAVQRRAADEACEEAGVRVAPASVALLGRGVFPSPGMTGEKFFFTAARVERDAEASPPEGDGSPMEEGARVRWLALSDALLLCDTGAIDDAKTELGLHRLARHLAGVGRYLPR